MTTDSPPPTSNSPTVAFPTLAYRKTRAGSADGVRRWPLFFPAMHVAMLALVLVGFGPTFYLRPSTAGPLSPMLAAHGAFMSLWMVFIVVQSALPAAGRTRLHRTLGWVGVGLAAGLVAVSVVTTLYAIHAGIMPKAVPLPRHEALAALSLRDLAIFAPLIALGVWFRNRSPAAHKRLMYFASLGIIGPAIGRITIPGVPPPAMLVVPLALLIAVIVYDVITRRRPHPATLGSIALTLGLSFIAGAVLMRNEAFLALVARLAGT